MDNKCKNIIFMKYGVHASEGVEQIIARKKMNYRMQERCFGVMVGRYVIR